MLLILGFIKTDSVTEVKGFENKNQTSNLKVVYLKSNKEEQSGILYPSSIFSSF